ncbi:hypothetical protein Dimus_016696 [Dionaea muscipula]
MVVASSETESTSSTPLMGAKKGKGIGVPTIDMSRERSIKGDSIVKACEEYGIFKVVSHGVSVDVIRRLESQGLDFFAKPAWVKQQAAGPSKPFGYGCKNIGFNGDMGALEYLILQAHPLSLFHTSKSISINDHPSTFSNAANDYIRAVSSLAGEVLDLVAEGLRVEDRGILSRLITDVQCDSILRLNHYPPPSQEDGDLGLGLGPSSSSSSSSEDDDDGVGVERVGFGEHTDPQILTVLRSNDVAGLQICKQDGSWVAVPPDSSAFYVMVGDTLQALTNGRFVSVRHRAIANSMTSRLSTVYFAAPPVSAWIRPLPETLSPQNPSQFLPFTWGDYKNAAYGSRLGDCRLDHFKRQTTPPS